MKNKKKQLNEDEWFSSFDLGLCSALLALGYSLRGLNKTNPKKVEFVFKRDKGMDEIINDYWNDKITVKAQTYWNNIKRLKNQIYSK